MLSCGLVASEDETASPPRPPLRDRPRQCGGFEVTRMRWGNFNGLNLMVSLSNHGATSFFSSLLAFCFPGSGLLHDLK